MKLAFMFPGQGAQYVGMGKDLYDAYEEVREVYQEVAKQTGMDVTTLSFESDIETLSQTQNTQIAIATMSLSIVAVLKKYGIVPDVTVGLSLGEYCALISAGYLEFTQGVKLIVKRGECMANNIPSEEFAMAAVMGLDSKEIEKTCNNIQEQGEFVTPANYNYSGQTVISGTTKGIDQATEMLTQQGAKRVVRLNTSGPFHTIKLEKAKEKFFKELESTTFELTSTKVIKNLDGSYYTKEDNMKEILANHIISPVRFDKAIEQMQQEEIDTYLEIGPGKTLSGFLKKENKEADVRNITDVATLQEVIEYLKSK